MMSESKSTKHMRELTKHMRELAKKLSRRINYNSNTGEVTNV